MNAQGQDTETGASADAPPLVMRAQRLKKSFGGQVVLDGVSMELRQGELVLLRGNNGSGKTTLLNLLTGNLEPDSGAFQILANGTERNFVFPAPWGHELNPYNRYTPERLAWQGIGRTWQEIRLFPAHTLAQNIALAKPDTMGENPFTVLAKWRKVERQTAAVTEGAGKLLAQLGLAGRENSSADMISLGQSKRVGIARAVEAGARILFLDEPFGGLDAAGIQEVMGLLTALRRERGITLVIIEHVFNIPVVLEHATTVWTLRDGRVVVEDPGEVARAGVGNVGGTEDEESEDRVLERLHEWLARLAGSSDKVERRDLGGGARLSLVRRAPPSAAEPAFELEDMVVRRGHRMVFGGGVEGDIAASGLSLSLSDGQLGLLEAPNGWGKTTLAEAVAGLLPVFAGRIRLDGRGIERDPPWERIRRGLSVLKSRDQLFPNLTVDELLDLAGLDDPPEPVAVLRGRRLSSLSGGEKQRVSIACTMRAREARVRLFDEPFGMLDAPAIARLQQELEGDVNALTLILVPSGA